MTIGNMRELGVRRLVAYCLNDACRHTALIDVSKHPDNVDVPSFQRRARLNAATVVTVDVRPRRIDL